MTLAINQTTIPRHTGHRRIIDVAANLYYLLHFPLTLIVMAVALAVDLVVPMVQPRISLRTSTPGQVDQSLLVANVPSAGLAPTDLGVDS